MMTRLFRLPYHSRGKEPVTYYRNGTSVHYYKFVLPKLSFRALKFRCIAAAGPDLRGTIHKSNLCPRELSASAI